MGWFWASEPGQQQSPLQKSGDDGASKCPYKPPPAASTVAKKSEPGPTACPMRGGKGGPQAPDQETPSMNPLNRMFAFISSERGANQKHRLDTEREISTIPRTDTGKPWEYPSPQQMYNAMVRKGYDGTDEEAVPAMVDVHNFLNEEAWAEIVKWESKAGNASPSLTRFEGRPGELSPKAAMLQYMGRMMPNSRFATEPPFDRHDWYVQRNDKQVRYIIDYYSGPPEADGSPVFYLDIRPAIDTPGALAARIGSWSYEAYEKYLRGRDL